MIGNDTLNDTAAVVVDSVTSMAFHSSVLAVMMIVIISCNGLLIFAIVTTPDLRTVTNLFILNLSLSDLMVGFVVIPVNFAFPTALLKGYTTCIYAACFTVVVCLSSITNIVAVTVDRYLAITSPLKYRVTMTPRRAVAIIGVVWVYAFVIGFLPVMGWRRKTNTCHRGEVYPPGYSVFLFVTGLVIPIVVSTTLYARILKIANRQANRIRNCEVDASESQADGGGAPNPSNVVATVGSEYNGEAGSTNGAKAETKRSNRRRNNRKAFTTVIYILAYFELSWCPLFSSLIVDAFFSPLLIPLEARSFISLLALGNSVMDPIIYGYFNRALKNRLREILSRLCCVKTSG